MFEHWTEIVALESSQQYVNYTSALQTAHIPYRTGRRSEEGKTLRTVSVRRKDLNKARDLISLYIH